MAVLPIRSLPDPVLRQKSKRVRNVDSSLRSLAENMLETMRHVSGVGLAAPQVGVPLRLIVVEVPEEEPVVLVNPQIVRKKGEEGMLEGCLSIPGYRGEVKRATSVTVKGLSLEGREVRLKGEGLLAQAFQHEVDHLNGVLYIDLLEDMDKLERLPAQTAKASQGPDSGESA